jgi:hypothetical protein
MAMGSGLLALAILAADGPSCPPRDATTFQVRVLSLEGLDWRTSSYNRLQPVARQGTSTVWTADKALVVSLSERARSSTVFGKIVSTNDATLTRCEAVNYVAGIDRYADGPINQSSAIAFLPKPERLDERFAVKLSGRKLDQGILTQVALEETHVDVIHSVPQTESLLPSSSNTCRTPADLCRDVLNVVLAQQPRESTQSITCSVQVPEISQAKVEGEWLIPNNCVLLVSLGVKTVADDQGKAVVRERVAVIEVNPTAMPAAQLSAVDDFEPTPLPPARLAMPALPARSIPQSFRPNGDAVEVDLPPLPEALASTELDRIKPAPYQPSPQAPFIPGQVVDPQIARTSYEPLAPVSNDVNGVSENRNEARLALLEKVLFALQRAGLNIDVDIDASSPAANSTKPVCEKCNDDDPFCPVKARSTRGESPDGSPKVAPELSAQLGVSLKDTKGIEVFGSVANLSEALKTPGRTETTFVPLGGNVALEIKTTVVPAPAAKTNVGSKKTNPPTPQP